MRNYNNMTVAEIVTNDYRTAEIFRIYDIDFCCGGKISLAEACIPLKISSKNVIEKIEQLDNDANDKAAGIQYNEWSPSFLADYIQNTHHAFVKNSIPVIAAYLDKIVSVHGENHPELHKVQALFLASANELSEHMKREELVLFPYIKQMIEVKKDKRKYEKPGFGSVLNPISQLISEHTNEGSRFWEIAALTNNYTVPKDACNTYMVTISKLNEFERDLHLHIHLENNILFPKIIEMENLLLS